LNLFNGMELERPIQIRFGFGHCFVQKLSIVAAVQIKGTYVAVVTRTVPCLV
jgi:hypothetical protein